MGRSVRWSFAKAMLKAFKLSAVSKRLA